MSQAKKPFHLIRISEGVREDARTWLKFLNDYNGTSIFCDLEWLSNEQINLYADAAGNKNLGCGSYLQGEWCFSSGQSTGKLGFS